ncbi:prepilin peptidase [Thioflexithrix psekupsensis]|uniref:Prepilin leader peptidase/N-methyltransferase n=2 Tax=Thioflexithrix psekupsensis TaxID=1570016 RepID=A0A251X9N2_9GAMM|nr:A24 family peptidase [Thioflexithrix psekupsensis]OUD14650.1 prepilin peptidase [Thioflexithrix psekupsensis]
MIDVLANDRLALLLCVGLLGLIVGSFLNVLVYRLPVMMQREWQAQCRELLELEAVTQDRFNLTTPASHCPHCGHHIRFWENIPIISYLYQRGRCTACHKAISIRYPLVELASALLSIAVAWQFGFTWLMLAALFLTWGLLAMSLIDVDHQLLPDDLTLPLLWLGLLLNLWPETRLVSLEAAVLGTVFGYLSLWTVYWLFKLITGKEGMGHGDFKLLALFGAWLGWQSIPLIILMSSLVGAVFGMAQILLQERDRNQPIPFGPYLACAGWLSLMGGQVYLQNTINWLI